ncbi:hypothetical protein [Rhodovulum sulfidophilum]|uniref:hypothetical protein n=1 Tax=Rhodovulum sulfidophilum TaxID=35806 RepID=UPI0019219611|nr:hypothetical protein [Rhodovulum sulfidophilum]MBL3562590.1 hypothetical protein [Rhodovulum sulfidophilum]
MKVVSIILLSIALGCGIGYLAAKNYIRIEGLQASIEEPKIVTRVETTEVVSRNTAVAIYENTTVIGSENNAAMMLEWTSVAQIGVDFSAPNWKWTSLSGIGKPIPKTGVIRVHGVLPPLKILNSFSQIGDEKETMISRIVKISEESVLGPILRKKKADLTACVGKQVLYRKESIDNAHKVILSLLTAAIPPRADGTPVVDFDLKFENEDELLSEISKLNGQPPSCEGTVIVNP